MVVFGFKTFYEVFLFILSVALAITIYRLSPPTPLFRTLVINNPAAVVEAVFVFCGGYEDYFGGVFGVVEEGVGLPFEWLGSVRVGEVGLLVYRCV